MNTKTLQVAAAALITWVAVAQAAPKPPRIVVGRFFDDKYSPGGYDYTYPDKSKITITKEGGYKSPAAIRFQLDANDYSGGSVCLYNQVFDLSSQRLSSALEFYIKGTVGGEQLFIGLLDEEISDGKKTQVQLPLAKYIEGNVVTTDWKKVTIPLADFPDRGLYWDPTKKVELPARIDWAKVAELRVSIKKGENKTFDVLIDNLEIVKGTVKVSAPKPVETYWDEIVEKVPGPKSPEKLDGKAKPFKTFYADGMPTGGFSYVYGGKTAVREQESSTPGNKGVMSFMIDDGEYSGITLSLGNTNFFDITKIRKNGGLYFWAKGKKGGEKVLVGIIDNQGNDVKVQTKLAVNDWVAGSTLSKDEWKLVKIPLKRFADKGKFWDGAKQAEVAKDMRWDLIQEFRISGNKAENKMDNGQPATIYIDQITFTENIDWVDPDMKWDAFKSKAPDLAISDFEGAKTTELWEPSTGPKSRLALEIGKGKLDGNNLIIKDYLLGDWVDVVLDMEKRKRPAADRDWTKHWAIKFDLYTEKPYQGITVQLGDKGREIYVSSVGGSRGKTTILVPLRSFSKFPYYQPPEAVQNGVLDLDGVTVLDFKPSGEGTTGSFQIDNIVLTNLRELPKIVKAEKIEVAVSGDFKKVVNPAISDAIYGINTALWDGDLLKKETIDQVKAVNHGVFRYPGGLRADDDHWQKVLDAKDWMVDTDEFTDWMQKVGGTAMFTVNFGTGTPEEAAAWVKHTNIDRKQYVKYWEIGNEIYGNWHAQYDKYGSDDGVTYGKRAREFIVAMKKVDPSIKVGVVCVLEGKWNENVLKATADVADAMIVHHYPQHFGEENDLALLSAPQTLPAIFERLNETVKKQSPKKPLEIWLTEWNSVDFNPGPQTISLTNGLFVADYLAELAKLGAGSAQYWDVHNDITPEGGDYGYLSRSYDEKCGNCPRPSYWAFKMAAESVRGKMVQSEVKGDTESLLTTYLTENGKKKSMMIVNKNPFSSYKIKLEIPGFSGKAKVQTLDKSNELKGPKVTSATIGSDITVGKSSVTIITLE